MQELYTDRLHLRAWNADDERDLIRIAGQRHIEYWMPDWQEFDKHADGWIKWVLSLYENDDPLGAFTSWAVTLKETGKLIGQAAIGRFDKLGEVEAAVAYFADIEHSGKGYTPEAVKAITDYAFETYGYDYIIATIQPENTASRRVAEKTGFKHITTFDMLDDGQTEVLPFCYYKLERPREPKN